MMRAHAFWILFVVMVLGCREKKPEAQKPVPQPEQASASESGENTPRLAYRDDWKASGTLASFRQGLLSAIQATNQSAILEAISDTLEINPGTEKGKAGVAETWTLDGTQEKLKPLADLLTRLVSKGGCLEVSDGDSTFKAPYYNCLAEAEVEKCGEFGCGVVVPEGADVRVSPSTSSEVTGRLVGSEIIYTYSDTICTADFSRCDWRKIERSNGQSGYIETPNLQVKAEGLLWLVKEGGSWKIRALRAPNLNVEE